MNILMVSADLGLARGEENVFRHTLTEFSRHWDHVDVVVPRSPGARPETFAENVHVHPCPGPRRRIPGFVVETGRRILRERPIHVVTAHSFPFFHLEKGAARLARRAGALYAVEVMHIPGHPWATDLDEWMRRVAARLLYRRVCAPADLVRVINSDEVPGFLGRAGVPAEKIIVRPCFNIDFQVFRPAAHREHRGTRVLYSGRLAKNKGLRETVEAVRRVRRDRSEVTLTIAGGGPLEAQVRRWVRRAGLEPATRFLQQVPHTELGDVYRDADVLIMASRNEGGPRVTLEAMACGTPVVSTRVGIMREVLRDGHNGLFCLPKAADIAEKLTRVLGDPALARRFSEAGPPAVAHFDYERSVAEYARGYIGAVERRPCGEPAPPERSGGPH